MVEPRANGEREKSKKKNLKSDFEKVQFSFLKNLIHEFRSVENHPRPVETDINSSQILKILKISIGRKTEWTDRIRQRLTIFFWEKHNFWKNEMIWLKVLNFKNKNAWKKEINLKKKGKKDLPASKDKNLAKNLKENDKNLNGGA